MCYLKRNISQRNATVFHDALNDGLRVLGNDDIRNDDIVQE